MPPVAILIKPLPNRRTLILIMILKNQKSSSYFGSNNEMFISVQSACLTVIIPVSMVRQVSKITCLNCGGDMDSIKELPVKDMSEYECRDCGRTEVVETKNFKSTKIAGCASS